MQIESSSYEKKHPFDPNNSKFNLFQQVIAVGGLKTGWEI